MFEKNQIKQIIKNRYPECSVMVFGSYARNEQTKFSDIDLLVLFDHEIDRNSRLRIQSEIRGDLAKLLIAADILVAGREDFKTKSTLTNHIFSIISREGVLI